MNVDDNEQVVRRPASHSPKCRHGDRRIADIIFMDDCMDIIAQGQRGRLRALHEPLSLQ